MKKLILWCLGTLAATIFAIVGSVAVISCENGPNVLKPAVGVEQVSTCLDSIVNPRLYTTKDVFELQNKLLVNAYVDSIFMSMDQKTLENVSTVVLKRLRVVTKDDIVSAFIKDRHVYENLPNGNRPDSAIVTNKMTTPTGIPGIVREETTTVTEAPPTRVENESSGNYKDTVIDGKHAIIKQ